MVRARSAINRSQAGDGGAARDRAFEVLVDKLEIIILAHRFGFDECVERRDRDIAELNVLVLQLCQS